MTSTPTATAPHLSSTLRSCLARLDRRRSAATMAAVVVALLLQILPEVLRPEVHGVVDVDKATIESGHLRTIPLADNLPWLARHIWRLPDQKLDGSATLNIVADDGVRLGPGDSVHAEIAELGGGRYSVWSGWLYFSLPDPTTQQLRWSGRAVPRPWCRTLGAFLILTSAAVILSRRKLRTTVPTILIVLATLLWLATIASYIYVAWGSLVITPDSPSYLHDHAGRAPGMYWVTRVCAAFPDGINSLSSLQGLAVATTGVLVALAAYLATHKEVGRGIAAVLAWLLCMTITGSDLVWQDASQLMTESLTGATMTSAFAVLAIAMILRGRTSGTFVLLLAGSTLLALSIWVRTTAALAVPYPLALILLLRLPAWRSCTVFIAPIAIALAIQVAWNDSRHGFLGLPALSGRALLGNVAPLASPEVSSRYPEVVAAISRQVDRHEARIDWSLDWESRCAATSELYNTVLWGDGGAHEAVTRELAKQGMLRPQSGSDPVTLGRFELACDALANQVAWDIIKANPYTYCRVVTEHFIRLYRLSSIEEQTVIPPLQSSWQVSPWPGTPPSSYERSSPSGFAESLLRSVRAIPAHRLVHFGLVLPASLVAIIGVFVKRRQSPAWLVFSALGFGIVACFFAGTAFYQVSLVRYDNPVLPILLSASLVFCLGLAGTLFRRVTAVFRSDSGLWR